MRSGHWSWSNSKTRGPQHPVLLRALAARPCGQLDGVLRQPELKTNPPDVRRATLLGAPTLGKFPIEKFPFLWGSFLGNRLGWLPAN